MDMWEKEETKVEGIVKMRRIVRMERRIRTSKEWWSSKFSIWMYKNAILYTDQVNNTVIVGQICITIYYTSYCFLFIASVLHLHSYFPNCVWVCMYVQVCMHLHPGVCMFMCVKDECLCVCVHICVQAHGDQSSTPLNVFHIYILFLIYILIIFPIVCVCVCARAREKMYACFCREP